MARRKKEKPKEQVAGDTIIAMQPRHFNSIIRQIRMVSAARVEVFLHFAFTAMQRMRLRHDAAKAVNETPDGSDQCDPQSFAVWTRKITKQDEAAKRQLIAIHATAKARLGG